MRGSEALVDQPAIIVQLMSKVEDREGGFYVVQQIQLSSQSQPEEVPDFQQFEEEVQVDSDISSLDALLKTANKRVVQPVTQAPKAVEAKTVSRTMVVDDFIRNFLVSQKMFKTLQCFQQEWYEMAQRGKKVVAEQVPDAYIENELQKHQNENLKTELDKALIIAEKTKATYDKLLKERDFHKMHHQRVQQEKKKLNGEIQKLNKLHLQFQSKYDQLGEKYSHAMKEKMLLKLERDRLLGKNQALQKTLESIDEKSKEPIPQPTHTKKERSMKEAWTALPSDDRVNPFAGASFQTANTKSMVLSKTFKGHMMTICSLGVHPKKSFIATGSDDYTWKLWTVPMGELIMSGQGHKDWVSGIDFHPKGLHLATSSGDSTIKIWDFVTPACTHTFTDHIQPVWSIAFNDTGDFLVSASMDHNAKLFDLPVSKARQTFRGHVDSVNHVVFQPFSNVIATCSADKTISIWDIRTGLCVQTLYGHQNSVNHVTYNLRGESLASVDSDGMLRLWDSRMVKERRHEDLGPYAANSCSFDKSGQVVAVASDEGLIKLYSESAGKVELTLKGHDDSVQDVRFDYNSKMLFSCGSDSTFRVWQ